MDYKIYTITGITSNGEVLPADFSAILSHFNDYFEDRAATTDILYTSDRFSMRADIYPMEQIQDMVTSGIVLVPFSKKWFVYDLKTYCDLGLEVRFMLIKDYRDFQEKYSESQLVGVEDHRTKALF